MIRKLISEYSDRFISRWIILFLDILFVIISFFIAYLLRFNFQTEALDRYNLGMQMLFITCFYLVSFLVYKPYSGIIRHTGFKDLENILRANVSAILAYFLFNVILEYLTSKESVFIAPRSIYLINFFIVTFLMTIVRFTIKSFYNSIKRNHSHKKNVIIYGAGNSGLITKHALEKDDRIKYHIFAIIDDNKSKIGKNLEGTPVVSLEKVSKEYLKNNNVEEVIIAIQKIKPERKQFIIDHFLEMGAVIKNIPHTNHWLNGEFSSNQIRNVKVEDLLEREQIRLNHDAISKQIRDKVVLVTGAAGSIGSEIIRQLMTYDPAQIILIDQAESPLYDLIIELERRFNGKSKRCLVSYVCDVCNRLRVQKIIKKHRPDIVYHAAAYKHVPLMEANPSEAVEVNVLGTKNMADMAVKYDVSYFVLVSTDKAVNPTSVMGASKRIAEMYCNAAFDYNHINTRFITTRFGNVLGSNGSVIPLFRKQIQNGGPITVTHKDVTRYFMTIPEACELVLEAGSMGNGREIFVFDMGNPVKIYDLAKKMIRLTGYNENEIPIKLVGLRPGEKLYEEVLSTDENTIETYHPKIKIAKVREQKRDKLLFSLDRLYLLIKNGDENTLVREMKQLVPEFKSNNSMFQLLDVTNNDPHSKGSLAV